MSTDVNTLLIRSMWSLHRGVNVTHVVGVLRGVKKVMHLPYMRNERVHAVPTRRTRIPGVLPGNVSSLPTVASA
jgi:hypothetical protein